MFARYANGFRAQTIQGRDVAFEGAPSVADAETINSIEVGFKSDLLEDTLRLNAAAFYYVIDDLQLSAIGGGANNTALINAEQARGYGFEVDAQYVLTISCYLLQGTATTTRRLTTVHYQFSLVARTQRLLVTVTSVTHALLIIVR